MNRMTELLERINYDLPGLKKAKMCYAQGDADGAMDAVIEHFRTRTTPKYLFTAKEMEQCKVDGILEDAQETLDHYIYGHKFDGEIDWFFNPTEHTSHDNEWTWSLYRHIYWQPLARAYALTKDEKYTKEFLHEMTEWGKAWPVTPFMENEEDAAAKYKFPGHSWRTIETAMRIYTVWLPCMEAFRTSPAWDREGWVTFLTLLCDHADFLMTHYSNHKKSSNWLTMESGTLLECGILFPEIKSDWFMTGYRRVMQEVKYSFDNDGIHMERTPIYHMVAAGVYFQCYRLCKLNGIPVPPYMEPTLEKSAQFIMSLVKPDLSTPMIGDADRDDLTTRRCDTSLYEGMNLTFDPYDLNEMRAYFRTWYEETGREDFRFMATAGKEGTPPAQRNYKYIGCVALANTNHWMRPGNYGLMAVEQNCIGIFWTNTVPNMPPWGGRDARLGNNPITLAIPHGDTPVLVDVAMSMFSYGKLEVYKRSGRPLPVDGGLNKDQQPTKNAAEILETHESYPIGYWKGSGLSLALDLIASALAGGRTTRQVGELPLETELSQVFICINLDSLPDKENIAANVEATLRDMETSTPVEEGRPVHFPGAHMAEVRSDNMENGIPVEDAIWQQVLAL